MTRGVLLLAVLLAVAACDLAGPSARAPLPEDVFVEALAEAHLAASRAAHEGVNADSLRAVALREIDVAPDDFDRTLDVYAQRPEVLLDLYDQAIDRLRALREPLDEPQDDPEGTSID